jgi:hypothetical protein
MQIIDWLITIFIGKTWTFVALVLSIFWGLRAVFYNDKYIYKKEKNISGQIDIYRNGETVSVNKLHHFLVNQSYEFIFHFIGSMAGWICFTVLLIRLRDELYPIILPGCHQLSGFNINDLLLFVFALLGLTGHLPQAFYGFVKSFGKLAESVANKISD